MTSKPGDNKEGLDRFWRSDRGKAERQRRSERQRGKHPLAGLSEEDRKRARWRQGETQRGKRKKR